MSIACHAFAAACLRERNRRVSDVASPPVLKPTVPAFDDSLPMALLRARDATMTRFRPLLADYDLTEPQWRVVRALHDTDALDISTLAQRCHVLLPSMSGILKRLEARGLVQRGTNTQDQRSSLISLTKEAQHLTEEVMPRLEARYAEIEAVFGAERLERLYELLFALEEALGSPRS